MLAYTAPVTWTARWALRATDWEVIVHLAEPVAAPAAEAVERFLPATPQAQIFAWPASAALPQLQLAVEDWMISTAMAEAAEAPGAQVVESFLPPAAEPQLLAWPIAAALPQFELAVEDWMVATAMAEAAVAKGAQAVETFLPPAAEPQILAWPMAAALPQLELAVEDWMVATAMAEAAVAPGPQAVESFLPPPAESQILAWPMAAVLPHFELAAEDWMVATAMADAAAAPSAQAVESFLPSPAEPEIVTWPAVAAKMPRLTVGPAAWVLSVDLAEFVAAPVAQAAFLPGGTALGALKGDENLDRPITNRLQDAILPHIVLPGLTLEPTDWVLSGALAEAANAPAAQAVESFLPAGPEPQIVTWPSAAVQLLNVTLEAAEWVLGAALADAVSAPAAQAVESFLPSVPEPCALPLLDGQGLSDAGGILRLPEFSLAAIAPEPVGEFVPPVTIANACENWMPSAPACEAVRDAIPAFSGALPAAAILSAPALLNLSLEEPAIRWSGDWRQSALAEPVLSFIAPQLAAALPIGFPVAMPETGALQRTPVRQPENLASPSAEGYLQVAEPSQAALPAIADSYRQSGSGQSASHSPAVLHLPAFELEHTTGNRTAAFQSGVPSAVEPAAAELNPGVVIPQLGAASAVHSPSSPAPVLRCGLPLAKPLSSDFICQRTPMAPIKSLQSIAPEMDVLGPKFVVRPIFERVEEFVAPPPKPVDKTPAFAEIFALSKAARKTTPIRSSVFSAGKLIAASLIVGIGMWFGAGSAKITRQLLAINTSINGMGSSNTSSGMDNVSSIPSTAPWLPIAEILGAEVSGRADCHGAPCYSGARRGGTQRYLQAHGSLGG